MSEAKQWRSILVVVSDLLHRPQLAVNKAAAVAERCGARITLLHTYAFPYPVSAHSHATDAATLLHELHDQQMQALEKFARPLRRKQLHVDCEVIWDFPAHDAIVRYAEKTRPDVVMVDSHRHGRISRWLLANTDWELIRNCAMPIWFVKTPRLPKTLQVIAAVDPLHTHAKPAALDDRIVQAAISVAGQLRGTVQLLHAYPNTLGYSSSTFTEPLRLPVMRELDRAEVDHIKRSVAQLANRHQISLRRVQVVPGDPVQQLPALARQQKAHMVVMGAVSRRPALRAFIGNTAEKVIDQLGCDVMVVKPTGFKTRTPKRQAKLFKV
jgi:universal stress protein E